MMALFTQVRQLEAVRPSIAEVQLLSPIVCCVAAVLAACLLMLHACHPLLAALMAHTLRQQFTVPAEVQNSL
jgi:hypothetical protein